MKRRFLGIPVVLIAVVLSVLLVGGAVLGQFFFQREQEATVRVLTTDLVVYQDAECTIPLPITVLDFGVIERTYPEDPESAVSSNSKQFYLKNMGDRAIYLKMWQTGIGVDLALVEAIYGTIGDDIAPLLFPTGGWTVEVSSTILEGWPLSAEDTYGVALAEAVEWTAPGVVKIDEEYIRYETNSSGWLLSLTRGLYGSIPAEHLAGAIVEKGVMTAALGADEVIPINFHMEAGASPVRGVDAFIIYINGQVTPW